MNRRFFLRSLGVIAGGLFLPASQPRLTPSPPEITPEIPIHKQAGDLYVINPEWQNAPYEISFWATGSTVYFDHLPTRAAGNFAKELSLGDGRYVWDPYPRRFRNAASAKAWLERFKKSI